MTQNEMVRECRVCRSLSQPVYRIRELRDDVPTGRYCDVCHSCLHSGQALTYQDDHHVAPSQESSVAAAAPSHKHAPVLLHSTTSQMTDEQIRQQLADSRHEVFQALTAPLPSVDTTHHLATDADTVHGGHSASPGAKIDVTTHEQAEPHFSSPTPPSRPAVVSRTPLKAKHRRSDS